MKVRFAAMSAETGMTVDVFAVRVVVDVVLAAGMTADVTFTIGMAGFRIATDSSSYICVFDRWAL